MPRIALIVLFAVIFVAMLAMTITASLDRSVLVAGSELLSDRWFQATLCDTYFAFITIYVWIAYKERSWWSRLVWLVLVMGLGTIAISVYIIIQLLKLPPGVSPSAVLTRSADNSQAWQTGHQ